MKRHEKGMALPLALVFMVISQLIYLSLLHLHQTDSLQQTMLIDYYRTGIQHQLISQIIKKSEQAWLDDLTISIDEAVASSQQEIQQIYNISSLSNIGSFLIGQDNDDQMFLVDIAFYVPQQFSATTELEGHNHYGGVYELKHNRPQWEPSSSWIATDKVLNEWVIDQGFTKTKVIDSFHYSKTFSMPNLALNTVYFNDGLATVQQTGDFQLDYQTETRPFNRKIAYPRPSVTVYFKITTIQFTRIE